MSRVSSRVAVRVAAEVAFFTTRPVVEVLLFVFFPVTLSLTHVPKMAAKVPVMAVTMAFHTFDRNPGFVLFESFAAFFASFSAFFSAASAS